MRICLGNLKLSDILDSKYVERVESFLKENGFNREVICENINKKEGNYHIFDMPKVWEICGDEFGKKLVRFLQDNDLVDKFNCRVTVSICKLNKS